MKYSFLLTFPVMLIFIAGCHEPLDIMADLTPPSEVNDLIIDKQEVDVVLTWKDPDEDDLRGIRISLFDANNQNLITFADILPDSVSYTFKSLAAGDYIVLVQTRDKENNLSPGTKVPFIFLSGSPVNVRNISTNIYWNVLHVKWDSLTQDDFVTVLESEQIVSPVDSIILEINDTMKILLPVTATGAVIADLPDGMHNLKIYTHGSLGYYSGISSYALTPITFGEKFVRVQGNGFDFYMARYEVTTEEYRKFIVDDLEISEPYAPYAVDNSKVENDAWYKWWYGTDPKYPGKMYLLGFNSWEFSLDTVNGWKANRYIDNGAFGKITWEGAMVYSLLNYNGRCPTQEEWLFAAKGGSLSKGYFFAGSDDSDEVGWWGTGEPFQKEVGLKKPNELGIFDMSGNVGEILYELDDAGTDALGKMVIIGGSMGPEGFWGNEGEMFDLAKPGLDEPEIVKHTGLYSNDAKWRTGIRVLIPHEEIIKPPVDLSRYKQ